MMRRNVKSSAAFLATVAIQIIIQLGSIDARATIPASPRIFKREVTYELPYISPNSAISYTAATDSYDNNYSPLSYYHDTSSYTSPSKDTTSYTAASYSQPVTVDIPSYSSGSEPSYSYDTSSYFSHSTPAASNTMSSPDLSSYYNDVLSYNTKTTYAGSGSGLSSSTNLPQSMTQPSYAQNTYTGSGYSTDLLQNVVQPTYTGSSLSGYSTDTAQNVVQPQLGGYSDTTYPSSVDASQLELYQALVSPQYSQLVNSALLANYMSSTAPYTVPTTTTAYSQPTTSYSSYSALPNYSQASLGSNYNGLTSLGAPNALYANPNSNLCLGGLFMC